MRNFWVVIILIAILLGLGLYFSSHTSPVVEQPHTPATSTSSIVASTTKSHIEDKKSRFIADFETPSISGHANAVSFNTVAKVYVDRAAEEFAQNATEANFNLPETFKSQSHEMIATVDMGTIGDLYVTARFEREYSMLAAAHPFHVTETLNYELDKEKVLELSDIFENVKSALSYVSSKAAEQVKAKLRESEAEGSFITEGIAPQEANYRTFIITATGITFYFDEYQVAPYAAGPQQAMLTWSDLRPLLTPQFKSLAQ